MTYSQRESQMQGSAKLGEDYVLLLLLLSNYYNGETSINFYIRNLNI